jgi:UDP-glucose 4-epimerase
VNQRLERGPTGVRTRLRELAELLPGLSGSSPGVEHEPDGTSFARDRLGCPRQAREEIGFEAATDFRDGLARLIEWRAGHRHEASRRHRAAGLEA